MDKELIKFQIDQLRKDKTLYVQESIALSILALLLFIGAPSVFPEIINPYLPSALKIMQAFIVVPVVFWIYVLVGNLFRLIKINRLMRVVNKEESKSIISKVLSSRNKKKKK